MKKIQTYLGDGLYAEFDGSLVSLMANDISEWATDTIHFDEDTLIRFDEWKKNGFPDYNNGRKIRSNIESSIEHTELDLLEKGCEIKYPSGYIFVGDPKTNYIELKMDNNDGTYIEDGLVVLNQKGLEQAHKYKNDYKEKE